MTTISSHNFSNYLRAHQKSVDLSQAHGTFLLSFDGSVRFFRYGYFSSVPASAMAIAIIGQLLAEDLLRGETAKGRQQSATTTFDSETAANQTRQTVRKVVIL